MISYRTVLQVFTFKKGMKTYQALFQKGNYNILNKTTITELKSALKEEHTLSQNLENIHQELHPNKFFKN